MGEEEEGAAGAAAMPAEAEANQFAAFAFAGPSPSKLAVRRGAVGSSPSGRGAQSPAAEEEVARGQANEDGRGAAAANPAHEHGDGMRIFASEDEGPGPAGEIEIEGPLLNGEGEAMGAFTALLMCESPVAAPAGSKRRLSTGRDGSGGREAEIEDWGGGAEAGPAGAEQEPGGGRARGRKGGKSGAYSELRFPPSDWAESLEKIRVMRTGRNAPVDLLGPEQLKDVSADPEIQKFHVLVSAVISSQTRDAVTAAAMTRLRAAPGGLTVQHLAEPDVSLESLEELLKPVSFYRQKARHLKSIAEILLRPPYRGSVPRTLDELMKLPGVGPKVGLLVLWVGFGMGEIGLIVDTNVRRVACRLGWSSEGATAEQVRDALEMWLPKALWAEVSFLFVGFGQQICRPVNPKCEDCQLKLSCPSAFKFATKAIEKMRDGLDELDSWSMPLRRPAGQECGVYKTDGRTGIYRCVDSSLSESIQGVPY